MTQSRETQSRGPAERKSFSHRTIYIGLAISLLCAVGVALYIYFRYVRYERVAAEHVPPGTVAALRVDLEKVVLYEPFRSRVLELVNERPTDMPESRLERLRHYTGIELGVDMRELVLAVGPGPMDFEIIVGGLFRSETFMPGVERMMADEGYPLTRSADGELLFTPAGLAIGQADDRTIVLASSERAARAALAPSTAYQTLGLSKEGPGGFALNGDVVRAVVPAPLRVLAPNLAVVDDISRVRGDLDLASDVGMTTFVELKQGTGQEAAQRIQSLLGVFAGARLPLAGGPLDGLGKAASRFRVAPSSTPGVVQLDARWDRAEVDAFAAAVAVELRKALGWR